jgi:hypothetical protein
MTVYLGNCPFLISWRFLSKQTFHIELLLLTTVGSLVSTLQLQLSFL